MPAVDVLNRALLPRTHCRAVDDDKCDNSHDFKDLEGSTQP
jgi:hypothetical protein